MLSQEEQDAVSSLPRQIAEYGAHIDLVRPGDTIAHATLIAAGNVGRFDQMRDGSRQVTAIYIPGDMCDLYSVVAPTTGWGLTSLGASTVLKIAHADLRQLALDHPNLAMAFWRDTVFDASILAKWVSNAGRKDALARIAHFLCEMGIRMERASLGTKEKYELAMTQEQIGDAMGLTSVHVNRMLRALKEMGAATFKSHQVRITAWDQLVEIADFSPTFLIPGERTAGELDLAQ